MAVVENAASTRKNTGTEKEPKWEPEYTLTKLLDPAFRLPAPEKPAKFSFKEYAANPLSGFKRWKETPAGSDDH